MILEQKIRDVCRMVDGWTSPEQAIAMVSAVVALRPALSVEIGVYAGRGLLCLALAHQSIGYGVAVGIDAYDHSAATAGQAEKHREFWGRVNLAEVRRKCERSIAGVTSAGFCRLECVASSLAVIEGPIGVLRIDGNHGEQAVADVRRFAPQVQPGGLLFLDDIGWIGGAVSRAAECLTETGWRRLYNIGQTAVLQR